MGSTFPPWKAERRCCCNRGGGGGGGRPPGSGPSQSEFKCIHAQRYCVLKSPPLTRPGKKKKKKTHKPTLAIPGAVGAAARASHKLRGSGNFLSPSRGAPGPGRVGSDRIGSGQAGPRSVQRRPRLGLPCTRGSVPASGAGGGGKPRSTCAPLRPRARAGAGAGAGAGAARRCVSGAAVVAPREMNGAAAQREAGLR
jgi:hypothetical protein